MSDAMAGGIREGKTGARRPTIVVTGTGGQVGGESLRALQGLGDIVALDRARLDLADLDRVREVMRELRPDLIVNAAAYTAVDRAESDVEAARRINTDLPRVLAEEASRTGGLLLHYSTDYVFDGALERPYVETDAPSPLNVYGETKLAGERAIEAVGGKHLIFRTSWVYGATGRNFLLTMLRLAREGRTELSVVDDQIGAPTWSATIAAMSAHVAALHCDGAHDDAWWTQRSGVYHLTSGGQTSWAGFARAVFAAAGLVGVIVKPIGSDQYPTPARRPLNSRLSCEKLAQQFGLQVPDWQAALGLCFQLQIRHSSIA
ncbi:MULTISPECIES: dTDP-4-dehydrorhamnose reductase [unclassified Paraburkholderia]|uniref:dTDP-4-dehydrorhamnose reductase n=1 Tax=unclassified Paraburkholderia TaxID=2615204 RepID=UPI002AAFA723|nr:MULTISPECIES: dTDP-4-dehydrorhamnose reductase [unclassified Paraburkholderia]